MKKKRSKRWLSGTLALSLLAGGVSALPTIPAQAEATVIFGDIDTNQKVDAADALKALQDSVKLIKLSEPERTAADVNTDGTVDASDALLILQHSVKLIHRFPADTLQGQGVNPWSESSRIYAQSSPAVELDGIRTTYQVGNGYTGTTDIDSDAVMVYINTLTELSRIDDWKESGVDQRIDVMIPAGRSYGEFEKYYPERAGKDIQIDSAGNPVVVGGTTINYMLPTTYFTEYKWALIDAICQKGVGAVVLEEPECFVFGSYSEGFKETWQTYYNEPWQDMTSSAEAQYKTCKLMSAMWVDYINTIGARMAEKHPDVELWIAAHSTISYNTFPIVSGLNAYTDLPYIDGYIGQTWSGTAYTSIPYGGERQSRLFEESFLEYASYPDAMSGQNYYSLSDAKDDNPNHTWDFYKTMWTKTVTAQLMQQEVNRFQSFIWPSRAFEVAPDDYKTVQLSVFRAIDELAGQESTLYAGTPGISIGLNDTLTWQHGTATMQTASTNDGFYGLTIPLIERGIPLKVTSLDKLESVASLEGVEVLILSYELMKPLTERVNQIIAEWVEQGGILLYIGGNDSYSTLENEWWGQKGQTPFSNLLGHLGLNDITTGTFDAISDITWCGPTEYGKSLQQSILYFSDYTMTYNGSGFTPLLATVDSPVGITATVGSGRLIACGLPASYFSSNQSGPQNLRDLVEYAVSFSKREYLETSLMAVQRGDFIAANAMDHSTGDTLVGNFVDLYDKDLPLVKAKTLSAGDNAVLLRDISDKMTEDTPRLAHTGGELQGTVTETAERTSLSIVGPSNATSSTRLLGNGKYPRHITAAVDGNRVSNFVALWDNATRSLLIRVDHTAGQTVDITVEWDDTPVEDTEEYTWEATSYTTGARDEDSHYLLRSDANAINAYRHSTFDSETVYVFDREELGEFYLSLDVFGNYLIEVSGDDKTYTTVHDYSQVSDTYIENMANRTLLSVFPDQAMADSDKLFVRIANTDATQKNGGGIMKLYVHQKKTISGE